MESETQKKLKRLEQQEKELEKQLKEIDQKIQENPRWQELETEQKRIEKECEQKEKQKDQVKKRILLRYLTTDNRYPYYTREAYAGLSTNIQDTVLESIREGLKKIAGVSLSKLKGSQIEDIVRTFIEKDLEQSEAPKIEKEIDALEEREEEISNSKDAIEKEMGRERLERQLYFLYPEIRKLQTAKPESEAKQKDREKAMSLETLLKLQQFVKENI